MPVNAYNVPFVGGVTTSSDSKDNVPSVICGAKSSDFGVLNGVVCAVLEMVLAR